MQKIVLKNDEIGLLPIKKISMSITGDLLSIIDLEVENNIELNSIIDDYKITRDFLLYIFIEQCSNFEIKDYLINKIDKNKLLNDVLCIKNNFYSNNLQIFVSEKFNILTSEKKYADENS